LAERSKDRPTRDDDLDFALSTLRRTATEPSGLRIPAGQATRACRKVLATRKPLLFQLLFGLLLLRAGERTFVRLLLNEPPRNTRLIGRRPLERNSTK
jgi:hypothetical protein